MQSPQRRRIILPDEISGQKLMDLRKKDDIPVFEGDAGPLGPDFLAVSLSTNRRLLGRSNEERRPQWVRPLSDVSMLEGCGSDFLKMLVAFRTSGFKSSHGEPEKKDHAISLLTGAFSDFMEIDEKQWRIAHPDFGYGWGQTHNIYTVNLTARGEEDMVERIKSGQDIQSMRTKLRQCWQGRKVGQIIVGKDDQSIKENKSLVASFLIGQRLIDPRWDVSDVDQLSGEPGSESWIVRCEDENRIERQVGLSNTKKGPFMISVLGDKDSYDFLHSLTEDPKNPKIRIIGARDPQYFRIKQLADLYSSVRWELFGDSVTWPKP